MRQTYENNTRYNLREWTSILELLNDISPFCAECFRPAYLTDLWQVAEQTDSDYYDLDDMAKFYMILSKTDPTFFKEKYTLQKDKEWHDRLTAEAEDRCEDHRQLPNLDNIYGDDDEMQSAMNRYDTWLEESQLSYEAIQDYLKISSFEPSEAMTEFADFVEDASNKLDNRGSYMMEDDERPEPSYSTDVTIEEIFADL